jgi:Abnormal spindle-like microcephaly-assoc'd, ASPM-SPD-2-Hydin
VTNSGAFARREWVLTLIKNYYSSFLLGSHSETGHDSLGVSKAQSGRSTYRNLRIELSVLVWGCGLILALACQQVRAAITRDALTSSTQNTPSKTITTPVFTVSSGQELLLAFISTDQVKSPNTTVQSVTGGGLTWALVVRTNTQSGTSEIWRAFAPSAFGNAQVSANLSQSVVSSLTVMTFTGVNISGTNGSGAIGAIGSGHASSGGPSSSLITTQNNSLIVGAGNDFDKALARTPLTGQSLLNQSYSSTGDSYWVQQVNAQTALKGTQITLGDSAPTSDQYNLSICEIVPAAAAATPNLTVSAASLGFGSVIDGTSSASTLTLSSTGTAAATISSLSVSGTGFSLGPVTLPKTLSPGQTLALPVTFAPAVSGSVAGTVTIVSNSITNPTYTVALSGTGMTATRQLTMSASSLNYGNVADGSSSTITLTATSSGNSAASLSSLSLSGSGFSMGTVALPLSLSPGQSLAIPVTFGPKTAGTVSGSLTLATNCTTGATWTVPLTGTGTSSTPQIALSATSLGFGNVNDGSSKTLALTMTSSGTSALTVNSLSITGTGYSVGPAALPATLTVGQSLTVQIAFSPQTAGSATGKLTINSNSTTGATSTVSLSGTGVATTTPTLSLSTTSLSFGSVTDGTSTNQTLTLSSTGTAALTVSSVSAAGTGFSIVGGSFPVSLNPGASTTVTVQFAPTTTGTLTGQLAISSNSSTGSSVVVGLSGFGETAVTHTVDLTWAAPSSSEDPVAGYHIYRAPQAGAFTLLNSSLDTQPSYADSTVVSGSSYTYQVKSVDAAGIESVASNQFTATIP